MAEFQLRQCEIGVTLRSVGKPKHRAWLCAMPHWPMPKSGVGTTISFESFVRCSACLVQCSSSRDTVKAFGIFVPRCFLHLRHNESVKTLCHALALDECRRSFMFTSWGGLRDYEEAGPPGGQTVTEVWSAGWGTGTLVAQLAREITTI